MNKLTLRAAGFVLIVVLAGAVASALIYAQKPPLGEVARKEQERRKALQGAKKTLTAKDLPPGTPKPAPPAPPAPGSTQSAQPDTQDEQKQQDERGEEWWRERITRARDGLRRSEAFLEALQTRVNVLTADFASRDDPVQRARIGEDRQKALAEMERVAADIAAFKKQIEEIEEEARKAGVPPGWLR